MWEQFYISHIRQIPYKRNHSHEFFRKKVYDNIKEYYSSAVLNVSKNDILYFDNMLTIRNNNASAFLEVIKKSIDSGDIDDPEKVYIVNGLLKTLVPPSGTPCACVVPPSLKIEKIIVHRRHAYKDIAHYSERLALSKIHLAKIKSIVEKL